MNRKRKLNELYKGVFKNDKKSCIVDLKPLDRKRELVALKIDEAPKENRNSLNNELKNTKNKAVSVGLKVNKNLGFGSYFENLREEIVQIFTANEDFISFEGLVNSNQIKELFNGSYQSRESTSKNFINLEIEDISTVNNKMLAQPEEENLFIIQPGEEEDEEEILYEDDLETIYKRKKPQSRRSENFFDNKIENNYNNFNFFPNPSKNQISYDKIQFDISNMVNRTNSNLEYKSFTESQADWNKIPSNKILPKNSKNLSFLETHTMYNEIKSRKNKNRSDFLENSENFNSLNFITKY